MAWPPPLPDHVLIDRWRPMHRADLAELRERVGLEPCEAIECVAVDPVRKVRQLVTAFRPVRQARQDSPQRPARPSDVFEAVRRAQAATKGEHDRG